jgi:hypothetical protein
MSPHVSPCLPNQVRVHGLYLHHNFVVALLSHLFGVQCRGGCLCAGPYSLALLGIGAELSARYLAELERKADNEVIRPGQVRLSLPHFSPYLPISPHVSLHLPASPHGQVRISLPYFVHPAALDFVLQAAP